MAALYLATKLCETPVRLKALLGVYMALLHRTQHLRKLAGEDGGDGDEGWVYSPPPVHASVWWSIKDVICVAEMQILKRLGFNMQVCPHPPL